MCQRFRNLEQFLALVERPTTTPAVALFGVALREKLYSRQFADKEGSSNPNANSATAIGASKEIYCADSVMLPFTAAYVAMPTSTG